MTSTQSKAKTAARVLLGLIFTVFGLNGFFHFLPQPPPTGATALLVGGFVASGYMFPLIKGTEVIVGLLLLSNRFVPLALTILAPVVVNILAFHLFLAPSGLAIPVVVAALGIYLAYTERSIFAPFFQARSTAIAPASDRIRSHASATV